MTKDPSNTLFLYDEVDFLYSRERLISQTNVSKVTPPMSSTEEYRIVTKYYVNIDTGEIRKEVTKV